MMSERFPATTPEQKESDVTDDACREAMKAGDFARVAQWYEQQERRVDADPTADGRFRLTLRLARLQQEAGIIDDETGELYAVETLTAAREDAFQRYDDDAVRQIDALLVEIRSPSE